VTCLRRFLPFSYPFGVRLPEAAERRLYEDRIEADLAFAVFGTELLATAHRFSKSN